MYSLGRFPVPDLSDEFHPPWYRTPLRTEVLSMELDQLELSSSLLLPSSPTQPTVLAAQFQLARGEYVWNDVVCIIKVWNGNCIYLHSFNVWCTIQA